MRMALILPDSGDACSIYRGAPWRKVADTTTFDGKKGFNLWQAIMEHDAVFMQRPFTSQQVDIARVARETGRKLVVDWDDDLTKVPPWNPNVKSFAQAHQHCVTLARLADVVTVTSKALADTVADWGGKPCIIPNAIDDTFKRMLKYVRKPIVLWRGSSTHSADLEAGREKFFELNKTHEIIFVGDAPPWAYQLKHRHVPVCDYAAYMATMNTIAPEYVFVPLADHPFNRAKSDIGAQEAYAIGAKLLHNGIGEYAGLPEASQPRWLSEVNPLRSQVLNELFAIRS